MSEEGKLREFRVSGILEGPDHPTGSGREVSFLVTATSKEEVTKRMKKYKWIFWQGEDLEETERLRLAQGEINAEGEIMEYHAVEEEGLLIRKFGRRKDKNE